MTVRVALARNTAWYGLVTAIGLVSGVVMSVILARGLGPALMGDLSYVIWVERTLTALATLGYTFATVRYTAEAFARGESARAWGVVRLFMRRQVLTSAVVIAVVVPVILWLAPDDLRGPLLVTAIALLPITIEGIYTHALQGAQRYDVTARTSTIKMGLQLLLASIAILYGASLVTLVTLMGATLIVSSLIQRQRTRQIYDAHEAGAPMPMTLEVRAYLVPLSIVAVLDAIVWDRSEVFFLGLHASSEDIAFFSLAFGLATRLMIIPGIAVGALLPAFSAMHGSGDTAGFTRIYRTALRFVMLVGVPLAAILAALAPGLVTWLYGEAYLPAAPMVGALAAIALISALRAVAWAALRAVGDRHCALMATAVAAAVNIGLAAALIPAFTTAGAVIAKGVAQVLATVWVFSGMARAHGTRFPVLDLVKCALAGVLTFLVTRALAGASHEIVRLTAAGAGGLLVFALACVPAGLLGTREWDMLTTSTRRLLAPRAGVSTP